MFRVEYMIKALDAEASSIALLVGMREGGSRVERVWGFCFYKWRSLLAFYVFISHLHFRCGRLCDLWAVVFPETLYTVSEHANDNDLRVFKLELL